MTHPLKQLRDIILNESSITSGNLISVTNDEALVSTKLGIKKMKIGNSSVRVGDNVVIEDNVVVGKNITGSLKIFER